MILLQSILIYVGLLFLMYILGKKYCKSNNLIYFFVPILLFTIVFGLRYGVGIDYLGYLELFNMFGSQNEIYLYLRYEPAFIFIIETLYKLKLNYVFLFILFAFLQISILYFSFKDRKHILPYLPIVLMLSGAAVMTFMNAMRQAVSFCFFLFSIRYIIEKKLLYYLVCILLAFLFHRSAILLLPIYFLFSYKDEYFSNIKIQIALLIIFYIIAPFVDIKYILEPFLTILEKLGYSQYIENRPDEFFNTDRKFGIGYLLIIIQYLILVINSKKIKAYFSDKRYVVMYDIFFLGIILEALFVNIQQIMRVVLYFNLFKIVVYSYTLCFLSKSSGKSKAIYIQYLILIIILVYSFIRMLLYPESNMSDYVFFFQEEFYQYKHNQYLQILNH